MPVAVLPAGAVLAAVLAAAVAAALAAGAVLAAVLGALLAPVDAAGVLQAATIAGTVTRPAVPARPLRTVRRVTASARVGSAIVVLLLLTLPDKIRQDQADCP